MINCTLIFCLCSKVLGIFFKRCLDIGISANINILSWYIYEVLGNRYFLLYLNICSAVTLCKYTLRNKIDKSKKAYLCQSFAAIKDYHPNIC